MAMLSRLFHLNHELDPARLTSVVRQNEGENSLAVYLLNGVRVNCTGSNKKSLASTSIASHKRLKDVGYVIFQGSLPSFS